MRKTMIWKKTIMVGHKHLKRLPTIKIRNPVFIITTNTYNRLPILAKNSVFEILVSEWRDAFDRHGWMVGRYVVMPDHVHFFCSPIEVRDNWAGTQKIRDLAGFLQQWKQWTSKRIIREVSKVIDSEGQILYHLQPPIWQEEFFDHLLRSEESYDQKWEYVRQNPVRKGLVDSSEQWPWQGEIYPLYK